MSFTALFVFAAVAVAHPQAQPALTEIADERTPMRCKPAPYYVAEQANARGRNAW
jgi:hypothetical protein